MMRNRLSFSPLSILLIGLVLSVVCASAVYADAFIQTFTTSTALNDGTIVRIDPSNSTSVEAVSQSASTKTYGIVVDAANPPSSKQADIATSGHFNILVSDQNGPVVPGDYLIVSGLQGIAMNDNGTEPVSVGQALGSFNGRQNVIETTQATLTNGSHQTVHVGLVEANINIASSPLENAQQRYVPPFLERAVGVINNSKLISPWRIYAAVVLTIATAVVFGLVAYAGIRNALVAVGRNPLAKPIILRTLLLVLLVAAIVLLVGALGVVLLLKL